MTGTENNNSRWGITLVLILLAISVTACGGPEMDDQQYLARVKDYLEKRELGAARTELKNALQSNPDNAEARFLLGQIYLEEGVLTSAEKELSRARQAGWDEGSVQVSLGEVLLLQGEFQKVVDEIVVKDSYATAVQADVLGLRAAAQTGLGQLDAARQTLDAGQAIASDSLWVLQSRVRIALNDADLPAASRTLEHALVVYPRNQDLWLLSAALAEQNHNDPAVEIALQKVIELDPPRLITARGRQAHLGRSRVRLRQAAFAEAQVALDPVLKAYPDDLEANYLAGAIAFRQGQYDHSKQRLLKVLKVVPEHRPSLMLYGALNYIQKNYELAAHYFTKAVAAQPDDRNARKLLGRTYLMLEQYDAARDTLRAALSRSSSDDAELLALVGMSELHSGDTESGIRKLQQAAAAAPDDDEIRSELAKAYIASGDTQRAIRELESALGEGDGQHQAEVLLVLTYIRAGEYDKALDAAHTLSGKLPNNPLPYSLAGLACEGKGDIQFATANYDKALAIQPDDSASLLGLARLDLQAGNREAARQRYVLLLEKEPNNATALVALAKLATQEGKAQKTLELLEKARKTNPGAIEPRLILADYHLRSNRPDQALVYAQEARKAAPGDSRALVALGRAQLGTGKPEAAETFATLTARQPQSPDAYYYLAQALALSGDAAGTRQALEKVLALQSDHLQAKLALGKLELKAGNADAALETARQLKTAQPDSAAGYVLEGDALMARRDAKAALLAYQAAPAQDGETVAKIHLAQRALGDPAAGYDTLQGWLEQHPDDLVVRLVLAGSYMADRENDAAIVEYERVLEKQPDNAFVLNDLAWLYQETGNPGALNLARRAYRQAPGNPAILDTYGWLLVQAGSIEFGLAMLGQAASQGSGHPDIRYHLAAALVQAGDEAGAREELRAILKPGKRFAERDAAEALLKELE